MGTTADISALLDLVTDRPTTEKPSDTPSCPYCGHRDLDHSKGTRATLIGGGDGTLDKNPNHRHEFYTCLKCLEDFTRETNSGHVWYTSPKGRLLRGVPYCFESYLYNCKCGGLIVRRYTKEDGVTPAGVLGYATNPGGGPWIRDFRIFFCCGSCEKEIETEQEYFLR